MAERFDGEQVDSVGQGLAAELGIKEGRGGAHGVDEDDGGLAGVDSIARETVAGLDAAQVGNNDCSFGGHGLTTG